MNEEMLAFHELIDMEKHYVSLIEAGSIKSFNINTMERIIEPRRNIDDGTYYLERTETRWNVVIQPQPTCKYIDLKINNNYSASFAEFV